MTELGPEARDLIIAVGDGDGPTRADRERVRRTLVASLGIAASTASAGALAAQGGIAAGAVASAATKSLAIAPFFVALGLGAGVGAVIVGSTAMLRTNETPSSAVAARARASVPALGTGSPSLLSPAAQTAIPHRDAPPLRDATPPEGTIQRHETIPREAPPNWAPAPAKVRAREPANPPPPSPPSPRPLPMAEAPVAPPEAAPSEPAAPVLTGPTSTGRPPENGLSEEMRLLGEAQRARSQQRPDVALEILAEYARRFPAGVLHSESLAAEAMSLCELGRTAEAQARADLLLRSDPTSPLVPRVQRSCARAPR